MNQQINRDGFPLFPRQPGDARMGGINNFRPSRVGFPCFRVFVIDCLDRKFLLVRPDLKRRQQPNVEMTTQDAGDFKLPYSESSKLAGNGLDAEDGYFFLSRGSGI